MEGEAGEGQSGEETFLATLLANSYQLTCGGQEIILYIYIDMHIIRFKT